jgi:hypothetical protein
MQSDPTVAAIRPPRLCDKHANPYVFCVGAARSGNTLLQRMLDAHPLLAVINETYWLPRKFRERTGLTREGMVTEALLPLLLSHPNFQKFGMSQGDLERLLKAEHPVRYEDFVARIFDRYAARAGKPLAGDKTPGYVRRMRQIHELWPRARFVQIIRDPRDVCLSMLDWRGGERTVGHYGTWYIDPAVSTALYWRYSVAIGREAGTALGPDLYHEVRYEDLVADAERELRRICEFVNLPYSEALTRFHEGKTRRTRGLSSKAQWLPPTIGLRDWRTDLAREDAQRIELAVGELLGHLGYGSGFDGPAGAVRERVARVFERFTAGALAEARVLPRDWAL